MEQNGRYTWNKMAAIHGTKWPLYMGQNGAGRFFKIQLLFSAFNI